LEERIKETGKKKVYLCEKINKAPTYLRDAKKQKTNIKGVELQILADELGTTPEYLTGLSNQKEKTPTPDGAEAIPGYEDLSEENKAKARDFIAFLLSQQ
jgi:hypothetical protein